ncbi:hypothetical protein DFH11DRAFT_1820393 [Phellopilus nigrolimitatus]|nr:hypothetical protein DFH11DRAFT_1820393 [Phellopilus nigrolimitatus]
MVSSGRTAWRDEACKTEDHKSEASKNEASKNEAELRLREVLRARAALKHWTGVLEHNAKRRGCQRLSYPHTEDAYQRVNSSATYSPVTPSPDASIVAYVSKMFAVATKDLPENKREPPTAQEMRDRGKE